MIGGAFVFVVSGCWSGGRWGHSAVTSAAAARALDSSSEAEERFLEFAEAWGEKYPAVVKLWENAWAEFAVPRRNATARSAASCAPRTRSSP